MTPITKKYLGGAEFSLSWIQGPGSVIKALYLFLRLLTLLVYLNPESLRMLSVEVTEDLRVA